ncbi:MAG: nucleotidyl transferase AbiEii/AbiGii toxin family protein [Prolixibacteraceae bacterium]
MHRFYNILNEAKAQIFNNVGMENNLPAFAVEKDWWVVQTLTILFETEIARHTVFKGGTSLSKAWNIIERFSEDVDLAVDRKFYGFDGELGKKQRTKLRKTANTYITETLYPELIKRFDEKGLVDVKLELEEIITSDQDPIIITVNYPNIIESPGYIKPLVQIELGCRSLFQPFSFKEFSSFVDQQYPDASFNLSPINIPTVDPERTLLEKIFLLHEEFQRPEEKIRVERLSRHLYDIYKLSESPFAQKVFTNKELYSEIVKHRLNYTKLGGVNYTLHNPKTINPIPPLNLMNAWKKDYQTMQEQMIHGESPNFEVMIEAIKTYISKINQLDWEIIV